MRRQPARSRPRRRRGSTLAECLFTVALATIVVTAATLLYSATAGDALDATAMLETSEVNDRMVSDLNALINNAIAAEVKPIGGRPVLKLTMPAVRGARNALGLYDSYGASFQHPRGGGAYLPGERVWIYAGSPNASLSTSSSGSLGTVPLLARRSDDAVPASADFDWSWTYSDGASKGVRRHPAETSFTFSVNGDLVSWSVSSRRSDGFALASNAPSNSSFAANAGSSTSYRELKTDSSALLRQSAPQ